MEWQEKLKSYFDELGSTFNNFEHDEFINKGEFSVYYELLVNNFGKGLKASDIVATTGLNRSYVYNILSSLEEKGLITTIMESSPKSYTAQNPIPYIDRQIFESEKRIDALKSFRNFVKTEIEPELNKLKQLTSSPIKETFFINSLVKLTDYVTKSLSRCKERIYLRTSLEFYEQIKENLYDAIEKLLKNNKPDMIRIICTGRVNENIEFKYSELTVLDNQVINDYQIVIDDEVFIFNLHITPFTTFYGVGVMMKDVNIAESYCYSLISSFKQIAYEKLPINSKKDLSQTIRKDDQFSTSLTNLFKDGWKIFPTESYPQYNYFALVAPKTISVQESRDAGIVYIPIGNNDKNELLNKTFEENKKFAFQGAHEGEKRFDIEFEFNDSEAIIEGFKCKVFTNISRINVDIPWAVELYGGGKVNEKNEFISRMVAFIYEDRAVIMTWALVEDNLLSIMKELRKSIVNS